MAKWKTPTRDEEVREAAKTLLKHLFDDSEEQLGPPAYGVKQFLMLLAKDWV